MVNGPDLVLHHARGGVVDASFLARLRVVLGEEVLVEPQPRLTAPIRRRLDGRHVHAGTSRMIAPTSGPMYSVSWGVPVIGPRAGAGTVRCGRSGASLAFFNGAVPSPAAVSPDIPAMAME